MVSTSTRNTSKPYFDNLPDRFASDPEAEEAFGRHIHWGYWPNPKNATGTIADFVQAAENLSQLITDIAKVKNGDNILDCGCGFGGTISHLNDNYIDIKLTGINIDSEQVERAQKIVKARSTNRIGFLCADACAVPSSLKEESFDVILAVECIFAFPSRKAFFREANRLLKPGGRLVICDFLPVQIIMSIWRLLEFLIKPFVGKTYGKFSVDFISREEYLNLSKKTGFKTELIKDITKNTLPTYPVVEKLIKTSGSKEMIYSNKGLEIISQLMLLKYEVLSFIKEN